MGNKSFLKILQTLAEHYSDNNSVTVKFWADSVMLKIPADYVTLEEIKALEREIKESGLEAKKITLFLDVIEIELSQGGEEDAPEEG